MLPVPKKETIDDIYKASNQSNSQDLSQSKRKRQSIKKLQTTADKYNNNYFNSSKSNEFSRQRRPSLYNFPLPAVNIPDNEGQEKKNTSKCSKNNKFRK